MDLKDVQLGLTGRVRRLLERLKKIDNRIVFSEPEQKQFAEIYFQAYSRTQGLPEILRRADFLTTFAERFPVNADAEELIVGSQKMIRPDLKAYLTEDQLEACGGHGNHGHIVVDYGRVLLQGLPKVRKSIENMPESNNKTAFLQTVDAFSGFIHRQGQVCLKSNLTAQAKACINIANNPPGTFHEALQLSWFIHIFLHLEGGTAAVSFGRLDQYVWPYLEADLEAGRITFQEAYEQLCCFLIKTCEGDESQNLIVGGADAFGKSQENPLSLMILRAMAEMKIWQPSISVRIGEYTSGEFWKEAVNLCRQGTGMPSFFNDPVVIKALEKLDIPHERACNWSVVGCYEATTQGDAYPLTVAGGVTLPRIFWDYLQDCGDVADFDAFLDGFKTFFAEHYKKVILANFEERWNTMKIHTASPFESICVTGCIESGLAVEEGGARFNMYGVNILGLGTLIDSLLSIRKLIFEEKEFSLEQMKKQLEENFPDKKLLLKCRNLPGKFGSDSEESNRLAADLSGFIANEVISHPLSNGVRPYPGFFRFGADIGNRFMATPDGRMEEDFLSYGCGPGSLVEHTSISSVLNSASCVDHASCGCGNPLTISFTGKDVAGKDGEKLLRQVVETYFSKGGFHLHINIVDAGALRKARKNPEKSRDLIVRVSGYSAYFIYLSERWQDALIERTELGM